MFLPATMMANRVKGGVSLRSEKDSDGNIVLIVFRWSSNFASLSHACGSPEARRPPACLHDSCLSRMFVVKSTCAATRDPASTDLITLLLPNYGAATGRT